METSYFLAANSGQGFYSVYGGFPGEGAFLHIIKGGPGSGKSGFMRRIAQEAARRGMDTELILCSGDPDSLDGLYIPALKQAWVDGTAPHVREPGVFGVDSDYVNLGVFCKTPLSYEDGEAAADINSRYKALYDSAYSYLAAEASVAAAVESRGGTAAKDTRAIIRDIFRREFDNSPKGEGRQRCRFISAISCRGELRLEDTVKKLCKQYYFFGDGVVAETLALAARQAHKLGLDAIVCPEPLRPQRLTALILPKQGIYLGTEPGNAEEQLYKNPIRIYLREQATERLWDAKALHDELEAVYRPYMDFDALTHFSDSYTDRLFN